MRLGDKELTPQEIEVIVLGLVNLALTMSDPRDSLRRQLFHYITECVKNPVANKQKTK